MDRRELLEHRARLGREKWRRIERDRQQGAGGLLHFVRAFWRVVEPNREFVEGWALEAICDHLEAVTYGDIKRLLINVPPGFSKSLLTDVFWPAWMWGALGLTDKRIIAFSYSSALTERDNLRFRDILLSNEYQELWGYQFTLVKTGETRIQNNKTGWKLATSIGGVGTGERGDVVVCDDGHNVADGESEIIRNGTTRWFREAMSNRLNDMDNGAIVVIMQRVHEDDISGVILSEGLGYTHLMIPMEYDSARHCTTYVDGQPFWSDPRTVDGELAWPERFSEAVVDQMRRTLGPYAYAGQYGQSPKPRGGSIFERAWWKLWEAPNNMFPYCPFIIAFLDSAYTEKASNDPSGFSIWGVFTDRDRRSKMILLYAWRKRLAIKNPDVHREVGELEPDYLARAMPQWGLTEWVGYSCKKYNVNKLLIESKASGISVAQTLRSMYFNDNFGIELVNPEGDKVQRAYSVQHMFSEGLIYAPDKTWAEMVIEEMETFPKAKHDDLTDSVVGALTYLRKIGFAQRTEEQDARSDDGTKYEYRKKAEPLYDC